MKTVKYTRMDQGDEEDYRLSEELFAKARCVTGHADAVLDQLKFLLGDPIGHHVDRFEHSLQTATRAHRDARSEDYVVMALLHDIGDTLSPHNHGDIAAGILKPYVSEELHFIVKNHAVFQGYYFWHLDGLGRDRNAREQFRSSPYFDATAEFCEKYDQVSFDPAYDSMPLFAFEPMVRRLFAAPTIWAS
jgi:predicted HD phosphohydrolase